MPLSSKNVKSARVDSALAAPSQSHPPVDAAPCTPPSAVLHDPPPAQTDRGAVAAEDVRRVDHAAEGGRRQPRRAAAAPDLDPVEGAQGQLGEVDGRATVRVERIPSRWISTCRRAEPRRETAENPPTPPRRRTVAPGDRATTCPRSAAVGKTVVDRDHRDRRRRRGVVRRLTLDNHVIIGIIGDRWGSGEQREQVRDHRSRLPQRRDGRIARRYLQADVVQENVALAP